MAATRCSPSGPRSGKANATDTAAAAQKVVDLISAEGLSAQTAGCSGDDNNFALKPFANKRRTR